MPRREPKSPEGTIVAVEGGPGYATSSSRDYYLELFEPLLDRYQLLLVDNRGTGRSAVIDCPELQSYEGNYVRNVRTCSRQLGADNDVWGTAFAVEDMAAVLDHLGIDRVDLYGDSYGTFFTQAFAVRHPERVRTMVLDAAYPVADQNPWYPDMNRAIANSFRTVCERDPGCAALGGDPWSGCAAWPTCSPPSRSPAGAHGGRRAAGGDDRRADAVVARGVRHLQHERLPGARRRRTGLPRRGDPAPLLRIASEQNVPGDAGDLADSSEGLYVAVICNDYPQLWDITSPSGPARPSTSRPWPSCGRRRRMCSPPSPSTSGWPRRGRSTGAASAGTRRRPGCRRSRPAGLSRRPDARAGR